MTIEEAILILQQAKQKKPLQYQPLSGGPWEDIAIGERDDCTVLYLLGQGRLRLKPEPREWWITNSVVFEGEAAARLHQLPAFEIIHVREVLP